MMTTKLPQIIKLIITIIEHKQETI